MHRQGPRLEATKMLNIECGGASLTETYAAEVLRLQFMRDFESTRSQNAQNFGFRRGPLTSRERPICSRASRLYHHITCDDLAIYWQYMLYRRSAAIHYPTNNSLHHAHSITQLLWCRALHYCAIPIRETWNCTIDTRHTTPPNSQDLKNVELYRLRPTRSHVTKPKQYIPPASSLSSFPERSPSIRPPTLVHPP